MSQYGKATAINTSILSHIWSTAQFNNYSDQHIKTWQNKIMGFLNNQGDLRCRMNYLDVIKKRNKGGLGILHIKSQIWALLAHWIVRAYNNPQEIMGQIITGRIIYFL